jgi:rfaE bifunctional protein kinase chain/domain
MTAKLTRNRLREIASRWSRLTVAMVGDVALDRYLHIDPALQETSLETGLPVHNVVQVRPQPGGGGNVLANLAALRPRRLLAVGFCGDDGEGLELRRALEAIGADLSLFITTPRRMTFTYTKPLLIRQGRSPEELSRLDIRSRTPTDPSLRRAIIRNIRAAVEQADVIVAMDQVPEPAGGVLPPPVKKALATLARRHGDKVFLADSRTAIGEFRAVRIKVNRPELLRHFGAGASADAEALALRWSREIGKDVFVTLGQEGILAASGGRVHHVPGIRVPPPVDIVGAGDTVLAHIAMALGAGASALEAAQIACLAASIVVKKIGTTGTATLGELLARVPRGH